MATLNGRTNVIVNGKTVDFAAAVSLMDDDLREECHRGDGSMLCEQEFVDRYSDLHADAFGEVFQVT
jgi:hypothetical protein